MNPFLGCTIFIISSACFFTMPSAGDQAFSKQLISDVINNRASIGPVHAHWTNTITTYLEHPEMVGAAYEFEGWLDINSSVARVNCRTRVKDVPEISGYSRFSFKNGRALVVNDDHLSGVEFIGKDFDFITSTSSQSAYTLLTDLRWLGVLPVPYSLLKNYPGVTGSHLLLPENCNYLSEKTTFKSKQVNLVSLNSNRYHIRYWLSAESGLPLKVATLTTLPTGEQLSYECETEWSDLSDEGISFPRSVVAREILAGKVVIEDRTDVSMAKFGTHFDEELFDWKSMELPDDFVVDVVDDRGVSVTKQWDASSQDFGPWEPVFLNETHNSSQLLIAPSMNRSRVFLLYGAAGTLVLLLAFYLRKIPATSANK